MLRIAELSRWTKSKVISPKKFFFILALLAGWSFLSQPVFATSKYYDFGPYYQSPGVLGFSFSSLENLPAPQVPADLVPPPAGGILPDSPFYFLEKLAENIQLTLTFDPASKAELRWDQVEERLQEAKTLIDQGRVEAALRAAYDYEQAVSTLTDNLANVSSDVVNKIEEGVAVHAILSQSFSFSSSPAAATVWSLSLDASRELQDRIADQKGENPLPEDLSTGIQALKEQGLISEEESNKIYGFNSRSEVREELEKLALAGQFPISELVKLDEGVARYYPELQEQYLANLQVAELKNYQSLPKPTEEVVDELEKWQENPDIPPSNIIRPYLWYNRAQDLVQEVDLSNFSPAQQGEVTRFYPAVTQNPSYSPPDTSTSSASSGQTPSASPAPAVNYLAGGGGPMPGDPTYFIKQFGEQFALTFTFDPADRARLMMEQAERRLAEAQSLSADSKKSSLYEAALQRYKVALDAASNYVAGLENPRAAKEAARNLEAQAARHEIVLEKGMLPPPTGKPELIAATIKTAEDAMDKSADQLDRPALPPALASRLGDLKAQGLILPEEVESLVSSNSRQEVRDKIRKLQELGTFPPADAKKLDESQVLVSSSDYNQLVEVRKVEELQNLRSVQTDLAQTPTLRASSDALGQREKSLANSIDTSLIKPEDLAGRDDLATAYQTLQATSSGRPINRGQFGDQPPPPDDAVLTTCPVGATFKQFEGCVWADSGKKINDYEQYRCEGPGQYYSFAARKCVPYQPGQGLRDDVAPICPANYTWNWQTQSCQTSGAAGGTIDPKYSCPNRQYYSFAEEKCVPAPKPGDPYPQDVAPSCSEPDTYWSWSEGKCILWAQDTGEGRFKDVIIPQPVFVTPDNPFYPVKRWGEYFQRTFAFTPQQRGEVSLTQAKERLAEVAYALKKDDKEGGKKALSSYISTMQNLVADISRGSLSEGAKNEIAQRLADESVEQNLLIQKLSVWAKEEEQDASLAAATSVTILGVDKASDLSGQPPIPEDIKAKIESLPPEMISEEDKKKLLEVDSRVDARTKLADLAAKGGLSTNDTSFLNEDFEAVDTGVRIALEELKKLEEIVDSSDKQKELQDKVARNEVIVEKLDEFQKTFEPGGQIDPEVRPYVRLTRIDEVAQTIRPDVVNLSDFQNRKDILLAVATLQEEFKPTKEALKQVEDFRRRNPNAALPLELARIEALSFSLGVRQGAGPCFLPTPPFPANTPCPAPGAAIPINSYYNSGPNTFGGQPYPTGGLVYGQGPSASSPGVCPDGYHWMYDSGGWCMSNSGSYGSSYSSSPIGSGTGYTPYSPYYTAPGAPPGTYPGSPYPYSPPSYYGPAPTYYTTTPPAGTVPGSGPPPTAPGQCPSGYHWMSDSGGWCMADGPTYVPGGYSGYNYYSPNLNQSSCGPGYYWDGRGCIPTYSGPGTGNYSPSSYQYGCTPGYYWDGSKCVAGSYEGSGWSDTAARSQSWCQPPSSGCGYNSYWDYGSCYCRSSSTYYGGSGPSPSNQCQGLSCGGGAWLDYSTCSCRYSGGSGTSSTGSTITCYPPSAGCPGGWYDYGTCSCKTSSSSGGSSSGSCPSGSHWMSDNGGYCMSDGGGSSGGGSTSSGSCPSGYHWMSDNGGWCMSDGSTSTSSPAPSSSPTSSSGPAPTPSSTSEPAPAPTSEPAPAPTSQPAPAPSP